MFPTDDCPLSTGDQGSDLALHLHAAAWILQAGSEVVIAPHLHTQHIEVGFGRFDRRRLLAVQECHFDHRQIDWLSEQISGLRRVPRVLRVSEIAGDFHAEPADVRVADRRFGVRRVVAEFERLVELRADGI